MTRPDSISNVEAQLLLARQLERAELTELLSKLGLLQAGEVVLGRARGGSESLVVFVTDRQGREVVRKISSSAFATAPWEQQETGVMSDPYRRALHQTAFLRGLPLAAKRLFPDVLQVQDRAMMVGSTDVPFLVADYERLNGRSISQLAADGELGVDDTTGLYRGILALLQRVVHPLEVMSRRTLDAEAMHLQKMERRLGIAERAGWVGSALHESGLTTFRLNGVECRTVAASIAWIRSRPSALRAIEAPTYGLVIGDCNTHNILIDEVSWAAAGVDAVAIPGAVRFLDPRGIGVGPRALDDPLYDWKFWHNSIGHYDHIFAGDFRVEHDDHSVDIAFRHSTGLDKAYRGIGSLFAAVSEGFLPSTRADPHWEGRFLFLMGSHFASMLPFHLRASGHGAANLTGPLAIYCESAYWLDAFIQWHDGRDFLEIVGNENWRPSQWAAAG